ncbi:hypothetical protein ACX40Y_16665 [Sphingomonas sp. RS6]
MSLPFTTPIQFIALALTLLAGLLLGMAFSSAGRKWRARFEDEREAHNATRERARDELTAAHARIRELETERDQIEAERARLDAALADRRAGGVPAVDPVNDGRDRSSAMRNWLYGGTDVLSRIRGIDEHRERALNEAGLRHFRDIETLPPEDERPLEDHIGVPPGTIADEHWREQAALLRAGNIEEHERRFR